MTSILDIHAERYQHLLAIDTPVRNYLIGVALSLQDMDL